MVLQSYYRIFCKYPIFIAKDSEILRQNFFSIEKRKSWKAGQSPDDYYIRKKKYILFRNVPAEDRLIISKETAQQKYLHALTYIISILIAPEKEKKLPSLN